MAVTRVYAVRKRGCAGLVGEEKFLRPRIAQRMQDKPLGVRHVKGDKRAAFQCRPRTVDFVDVVLVDAGDGKQDRGAAEKPDKDRAEQPQIISSGFDAVSPRFRLICAPDLQGDARHALADEAECLVVNRARRTAEPLDVPAARVEDINIVPDLGVAVGHVDHALVHAHSAE